MTLFIAALCEGSFQMNETRIVTINAGAAVDIEYGDIQTSFLIGIEISSKVDGCLMTSCQTTDDVDSDFCMTLNNSHLFEINNVVTLDVEMLA